MATHFITRFPLPLLKHVFLYLHADWQVSRVCRSFNNARDLACKEIVQDLGQHPQLEGIIRQLHDVDSNFTSHLHQIRYIFMCKNEEFSLGIENPKHIPLLELVEKADAICSQRLVARVGEELGEHPPSEGQEHWIQAHAMHIARLDLCTIIGTVRKEIRTFTHLTFLNMSSTDLWEFPDLQRAKKLQFLYLSNNRIHTIPKWLSQLSDLQVLNLSNNNLIQDLPISTFPSGLRQLIISRCGQTRFPPIRNLTQLEVLDISRNKIPFVPRWIKHFNRLHCLNLSHNPLHLRSEMARLTQLHTLNLSYTKLDYLPRWIKNLKALKSLHLDGNYFNYVPLNLRDCTQLEELHMAHTPLLAIPSWIIRLNSLSVIDFSETHLYNVPWDHLFPLLPRLRALYV